LHLAIPYKLLTGKEKINYKQFFNFTNAPYSLRGHEKKPVKDRSRLDTRKFSFSDDDDDDNELT